MGESPALTSWGEAVVSDLLVARPYIDGRFQDAGTSRPVTSPFDGRKVGEVQEADTSHVQVAVEAARRAQREWAALPVLDRVDLLYRGLELCRQRNDMFAEMITKEVGKTIRESREEMVEYACDHFRRAAEDVLRYRGQVLPTTQERTSSKRILVTHRPAGVV